MQNGVFNLSDDFLLTLVHDLRALVRKSLSGLQLIERSMADQLDLPARQRFEPVVSANKELEQFLGRLSDYANAAHPPSGRPLPLSAILQAAILQFPEKPVSLTEPFPAGAADIPLPLELIRVFSELIDNALKFSRNAPVNVKMETSENTVQVSILDSGIGLSPSNEEQVFELLTRLHSRDEYPGFGLGLPICRRLASAVGASVHLTPNSAGPGAVAIVNLPLVH